MESLLNVEDLHYYVHRGLLALMALKDPLERQVIKESVVMMESLENLVNQENKGLKAFLEDA